MKHSLSLYSFSTSLLYLLSFSFSHAATVYVPGDYPNIQQAILFASNGDTILVGPGTWTGTGNTNIDLLGKEIAVISAEGPENTTIDCQGAMKGFYVHSGEGPNTEITGFRIIGSGAPGTGGYGIYLGSSISIRNCILENNFIGIGIFTTMPIINDCIIRFNGKGITCPGGTNSAPVIRNCIIINNGGNPVLPSGSGITVSYSSMIISNCLISDNVAEVEGGGIFIGNDPNPVPPMIINCTISGNSAKTEGGGIYAQGAVSITNSIIWGNSTLNGNFDNLYAVNSDVSYSNIGGNWPGSNNINTDPSFTDPANGNYRLQPTSLCIDAGTNTPVDFPTDLDGNTRIWDGNGDGTATADMGAYEFGAPLYVPLAITLQPLGASVCAGTDVVFSVGASGTGLSYQWKKNGINIPNATDSIFTLVNATTAHGGTYTCVVSDFSGATVSSAAAVLQVTPMTEVSVSISATAPLCSGVPITFTATATGGGNTPSYQWQLNGNNTGGNSPTYTTTLEPGVAITCILTSSVACPSANPVVSNTLTVLPSPDAGIASNAPLCEGDVLMLTASGGVAYFWQGPGGFTSTQVTVIIPDANLAASGEYSVTVTDLQGCTGLDMENVVVNELPEVSFDCLPAVVYDTASAFSLDCGAPNGGTYMCDGIPCDEFSPMAAGAGQHEIAYTFTDANGCTGSDTTLIVVALSVSTQESEGKMQVKIFPNPSCGWFIMQAEGFCGDAQLEIWNSFGQVLKAYALQIDSPFRYELDISELPKGMYSVHFRCYGWMATRSISIH